MRESIHLLLGPPLDWTASHLACRARTALHATWDRALVTCAACLQVAREPCTCGPETLLCPACSTYNAAHRGQPTTLPERRPGRPPGPYRKGFGPRRRRALP
jgi:hypothetical protein